MRYVNLCLFISWLLMGCGHTLTPTPGVTATLKPSPIVEKVEPTATQRPTATLKIATPLTNPTPTPTPTPIIYIIQPGDTLLKIAIQFDRFPENIQETNGIVDPRFLQIGQTLIIPPAEVNLDASPTPTPTPPPLTVTSIYFQRTPQGALWSLGSVHNPGSEALTEVVVEAALLDGSGVLLAREAAFTQLDAVLPGESIPFAILFNDPPTEFAQYQVVAIAAVPLSAQARYYFDLETFDLHGRPAGELGYRVRGQLRNKGNSDVETIRLVVIAYDAEDRVLAQRQADLAVTLLKAGAATPFELDLIIPEGKVEHYEVLAQGLQLE